MLNLGEYHSNNHHINISTELKSVQDKIHDFPLLVKMDLTKNVEKIEKSLIDIQDSVRLAMHNLGLTMENMIKKVDNERENIKTIMQRLENVGDLLWSVSVSTTLTVLCISLLLSIGLLLGIIHAEGSAKITFILGAILIAFGSFGLAAFTIVILLAGSHGEVFLCRPLYDSPNYQVFSKLFDRPGWVYENETANGIVNDFLSTPDVNESKHFDISLATAIERCEQNDATFSVFQFERIVNISQIFDVHVHSKLEEEIEVIIADFLYKCHELLRFPSNRDFLVVFFSSFSLFFAFGFRFRFRLDFSQKIFVSAASFVTLTEDLQNILTYMFTNSDINFLAYRTDLSRPTPEKDLSTFIDQMQRVSVQVGGVFCVKQKNT